MTLSPTQSIRTDSSGVRIAPTTIGVALLDAATRYSDSPALVEGVSGDGSNDARMWTYAELAEDAANVARALLARFSPGERVAVWSTNRPEWILLQFGAALAGLTLVTVNPAYKDSEVAYVLGQSRADGLFVEPSVRSRDLLAVAKRVNAELPTLRAIVSLDDWQEFAMMAADGPRELPRVDPRDPAQIQYTSGTTGFPKGALLAHDGLALNGRVFAETIGAGRDDTWINPMPLFHTAGCGLATLGALQTGGCQVLPRAFDADVMLDLFERHSGTVMLSVPTMLIRILDAQRERPRDVSTWRLTALGGAPVPTEIVRRAQRDVGVEVLIGFGQTESSPYITHTVPDDPHPLWFETIGRPLPGVEVKIADQATGEVTQIGGPGEICTRGRCVMLGYFDDEEATARAIDPDGWLHTGDVGSMDEHGYLRVSGRIKDLIIRGGENIYPREVEDVLYEHPAVENVAVVGLPDEHWGETVAAFVQLRPGVDLDKAELEALSRSRLASYKVPRVWQVVTQLPQTASGKVQKFALRDAYLAERPAGTGEAR
ncbi:AMP-binding protein [Amycolatopsis jiangsuensis]|uniref:Fatty-acyl-CoA synthase n=1 Tax=Amycolatopsis jiangsuensis TaxID=1181879 RepID=A0A840J3B0_9PSEU|nr:AMP-binding protein [Amycolatopsis jiangsuensis]MBB4689556.1 fatty-acyl-CoA synthase [Amycolatopsis jiangsuensis]